MINSKNSRRSSKDDLNICLNFEEDILGDIIPVGSYIVLSIFLGKILAIHVQVPCYILFLIE
jgi:hypothetical protein